ncbi:hypothetical protein KSP39_PZI016953 [Platanthera zijinensis]|uniref:Uncharacterized protein n=1 Tax=Platanthera zijinensis TaxID=2320716 RepID=A0AAP0B6D6_9ASPA
MGRFSPSMQDFRQAGERKGGLPALAEPGGSSPIATVRAFFWSAAATLFAELLPCCSFVDGLLSYCSVLDSRPPTLLLLSLVFFLVASCTAGSWKILSRFIFSFIIAILYV